ncbi:MAG TPA: DUF5658 family protein [Defluviitaleaceae bacterium]|nr:DUF5658 family protein [Defluviitaleaceae bacterium]
MSEFSKTIFINITKKYFYYIAVFNIIDMLLTLYATTKGYGVEINPFLSELVNYPVLFVISKGVLPSLLLLIVFYRLRQAKAIEIKKKHQVFKVMLILVYAGNHFPFYLDLLLIYILIPLFSIANREFFYLLLYLHLFAVLCKIKFEFID